MPKSSPPVSGGVLPADDRLGVHGTSTNPQLHGLETGRGSISPDGLFFQGLVPSKLAMVIVQRKSGQA